MSDGVIIELLLIFDAISPSSIGLLGLISAIYVVSLVVLICLRDRWSRIGPTRKEFAIMVSTSIVFLIPIIITVLLWYGGVIDSIDMSSPILILSLVLTLGTIYASVLIIAYGTKK